MPVSAKKPLSFGSLDLNDGVNYESFLLDADSLPVADIEMAERMSTYPLYVSQKLQARILHLRVNFRSETEQAKETMRNDLFKTLSTESKTEQTLIIAEPSGIRKQVQATVESAERFSGGADIYLNVAEPVWESYHLTTTDWTVTGTGQTQNVTNNGNHKTRPEIDLVAKTVSGSPSYPYGRPVTIYSRCAVSQSAYPVEITGGGWDTTVEVGASKMQADGDDLRVFNNGREIPRWVDSPNTASTKVWVNLDFPPSNKEGGWTLYTDLGDIASQLHIGDTGISAKRGNAGYQWDVDYILVENEIIGVSFMSFGRTIDYELIVSYYITARGCRGTTKVDHASGVTLWLINNDLWVAYGDATATAPLVDDDYKPMFDLGNSTNDSWDYDEFAEIFGFRQDILTSWKPRAGTWIPNAKETDPTLNKRQLYTNISGDNPLRESGLVDRAGVHVMGGAYLSQGHADSWYLENMCEITQVTHSGNTKQDPDYAAWRLDAAESHGHTEEVREIDDSGAYTAYGPHVDAMPSNTTRITFYMNHIGFDTRDICEWLGDVTDATVALDTDRTPTSTLGSETNVYYLDCTLTNNTTEEEIGITAVLQVDERIRVDCKEHTVIHVENEQNLYQALDLGVPRIEWMTLEPGTNEIQFDDDNLGSIQVIMRYRDRWL